MERILASWMICLLFLNQTSGKESLNLFSKRGKSFGLSERDNTFLLDGAPFRYVSGSIHYFRVHPTSWRDRLRKIRYAGCNAIQTYVEWSSHEQEPGEFNFSGGLNLTSFLKIAQSEDLFVILRPGPYIDAERDMGGLPYWLLRENPDVKLRTSDPKYLLHVERWFETLFNVVKPLLYQNGGPIIMVQVENEYGSYPACDFSYTAHLRDLIRSKLGEEVFLFSTDGCATSYLKCGKVPEVFATVDFGSVNDVEAAFKAQRLFEPHGPLVNSEFYPGWLDHWGHPHSEVKVGPIVSTLDKMLAMNASVNIYMFHGGTSFGTTSGSNIINGKFLACPTSYDYDAPLTEAGDYTLKYFAIRDVITKYLPMPAGPLPQPSLKCAYGDVTLYPSANLFQLLDILESKTKRETLTFEELSVSNGIVVYQTLIPHSIADPSVLHVSDVHDRGYVYVERDFKGFLTRELDVNSLLLFGKRKETLSIIIESQGRNCFGPKINDFKGITSNVALGGHKLLNWKMTPIPLLNYERLQSALSLANQKFIGSEKFGLPDGGMTFYGGFLEVPRAGQHPKDTFLKLDGWTKGYAWINGFLLGRYWPAVGPQITLYVPAGILKQGPNSILLLELEGTRCSPNMDNCLVEFVDSPNVDGPTPQW